MSNYLPFLKSERGSTFLKLAILALVMLLLLLSGTQVSASAPPVVNGLFYGDGDFNDYIFLSENPNKGKLYYYLDGSTLYIAVVVQRGENDNVFGDVGDAFDTPYVEDAGWAGVGNKHDFKALERSEHLEFNLTCASGAISDTWFHGYIYDVDGDLNPAEADWASGPGDDSTGGTPPANVTLITTASSLMWNLNNFASGASPSWDITLGGTRGSTITYKSPGDGATDVNVTDEVGYPPTGDITFDTVNGWEWPVVYEFSADISACSGTPFSVTVVSAHNSPPKGLVNDIPIDTFDYGDLPDTYGTTSGSGGARHLIQLNGPRLGVNLDAEQDGNPNATASGDDTVNTADEDGVVPDVTDWTDGTGEAAVTVSNGDGCLNIWIDFADDAGNIAPNGDGDFNDTALGVDEHVVENMLVSSSSPQPIALSITLPPGIPGLSELYMRTRLTPRDAAGTCTGEAYAGGVASSTGDATGGEVEDQLVLLPAPTAISLQAVTASTQNTGLILTLAAVVMATLATLAVIRNRRTAHLPGNTE